MDENDVLRDADMPAECPAEEIPDNNERQYPGFFRSIPVYTKVIACLAAVCLICHITAAFSPSFANFFTDNIAHAVRFLLAKISLVWPFSLIETIIICLPFSAVFFLIFILGKLKDTRKTIRALSFLLSVLMGYYCLFVLTFACGYRTDRIDVRLGMKRRDVSAEELYYTSERLLDEINEVIDEVRYGSDGFSVMPYDINEMSRKLCEAYDKLHAEHSFIKSFGTRVKPVALSVVMSYMHVTGVYSSVTGEANINIDFPDYSIPYTAAHELAHQRGVSREDEANFVGFLVCLASDDPYIRYSGAAGMLEYTMNALYSADSGKYYELFGKLPSDLIGEFRAYSLFFDKYRDSTASKVNDAVNDTYLKLQGTEGTKSYGLAVDLAVAYYLKDAEGMS